MNHIPATSDAASQHGLRLQDAGSLLMEEEEGSEACRSWGSLLAVFGEAMRGTVVRMQAQVPGADELMAELQSASRRYGAMVEGICMRGAKGPKGPCLVYDLADGYAVMLLQQGEIAEETMQDVVRAYGAEQCVIPEDMFTTFLGQAMDDFFARHGNQAGVVTVQIGGCEYIFMPADQRDAVLRDLKIGTSADEF